eukprot:3540369-Amphidinium_carterae.1
MTRMMMTCHGSPLKLLMMVQTSMRESPCWPPCGSLLGLFGFLSWWASQGQARVPLQQTCNTFADGRLSTRTRWETGGLAFMRLV